MPLSYGLMVSAEKFVDSLLGFPLCDVSPSSSYFQNSLSLIFNNSIIMHLYEVFFGFNLFRDI